MRTKWIADTGPLVALLNARDRHHVWARELFAAEEPPLATCEAVVSEACFFLRGIPGGAAAVLGLLERGVLELSFRLEEHQGAVRSLMARYADVPMSLADACLVRMAEGEPECRVLTLDRDFRVYRRHGRQVLPVAMPE